MLLVNCSFRKQVAKPAFAIRKAAHGDCSRPKHAYLGPQKSSVPKLASLLQGCVRAACSHSNANLDISIVASVQPGRKRDVASEPLNSIKVENDAKRAQMLHYDELKQGAHATRAKGRVQGKSKTDWTVLDISLAKTFIKRNAYVVCTGHHCSICQLLNVAQP
jgi:hypothetical protein